MISSISTGNRDLDDALGVGGLPVGTLVEIGGLPSADLALFLHRFLSGIESRKAEVVEVNSGDTRQLIRARVDAAVLRGLSVLIVLPTGSVSTGSQT